MNKALKITSIMCAIILTIALTIFVVSMCLTCNYYIDGAWTDATIEAVRESLDRCVSLLFTFLAGMLTPLCLIIIMSNDKVWEE